MSGDKFQPIRMLEIQSSMSNAEKNVYRIGSKLSLAQVRQWCLTTWSSIVKEVKNSICPTVKQVKTWPSTFCVKKICIDNWQKLTAWADRVVHLLLLKSSMACQTTTPGRSQLGRPESTCCTPTGGPCPRREGPDPLNIFPA